MAWRRRGLWRHPQRAQLGPKGRHVPARRLRAGFAIWDPAGPSGLSSTGALDVAVEVAMIFQLRPTTTGASLRWHRDVSWVCGSCTATPGASRRRKTQVPARVLCLSGSCRLSHAEKHGSQRAKVAAVPARAGQMKVSHAGDIGRATSAYRRTRHRAASTARCGAFRHRPASLAFLPPFQQRVYMYSCPRARPQ